MIFEINYSDWDDYLFIELEHEIVCNKEQFLSDFNSTLSKYKNEILRNSCAYITQHYLLKFIADKMVEDLGYKRTENIKLNFNGSDIIDEECSELYPKEFVAHNKQFEGLNFQESKGLIKKLIQKRDENI